MTPRERAESLKKLVTVDIHQDFWDSIRQQIEQAILADRQALQSELEKRLGWLRKQDCEKYIAYEEMIDVIQSVFAQQSKPFSVFRPAATYFISKAECMRRISADRQALQSELEGLIEQYKSCFLPFTTERIIIIKCLEKIQSVFAQQSQPEEGKPKIEFDSGCPQCAKRLAGEPELCQPKTCPISKAESDRRVLAEREACAKLADERMLACLKAASDFPEGSRLHTQASEWAEEDKIIAGQIRARSNQEAEENAKKIILDKRPCGCTSFTDGTVKECGQWHVMPAPSIDQSARIATLHEWQARDALTIQKLNESNNLLSEKIAQLEKEKNELTQIIENRRITDAISGAFADRSSPANRKA